VPLGVYRRLKFGLVLHPQFAPDAYLAGAGTRQSMPSRDHHGPRAVMNAVERLASGNPDECKRTRENLAVAEGQERDYRERLGIPFQHMAYLTELTALRDKLKAGLAGVKPEDGAEPPSVAELAERIKTLKAGNTVEAAPQRTAKRQVSAEEPVTSRIRRREAEGEGEGEWQRRVSEAGDKEATRSK
jgi:hypothetical protein